MELRGNWKRRRKGRGPGPHAGTGGSPPGERKSPGAVVAGKSRIRSVAREPQLRVPTAAQTLLAVHAGDGGAHHRRPERSISESHRLVHFGSQRRRHEKGGNDYLCGG